VTDPEGRAAARAYAHRGTPGVAHLDALGRTFLTIEDNGALGAYSTRLKLDLEGNPLLITDARLNAAMTHVFAMGGRALSQKSCDAGERWMLADVAGAPLRGWDERGHTVSLSKRSLAGLQTLKFVRSLRVKTASLSLEISRISKACRE
jgi:hypothetical protein